MLSYKNNRLAKRLEILHLLRNIFSIYRDAIRLYFLEYCSWHSSALVLKCLLFIFKHKRYYANGFRVPRPVKTQQKVSAPGKVLTSSSYDVVKWNRSRFYVFRIRAVVTPTESIKPQENFYKSLLSFLLTQLCPLYLVLYLMWFFQL